MSDFTYILCDLTTDTVICEMPCTGVTFSSNLNQSGTFQGTLNLGDTRARSAAAAINPAKTALYVDWDGSLVWGGIVWTAAYDSTNQTLRVGGNDFWSYLANRVIRWANVTTGIAPVLAYPSYDTLAVVEDLVNRAQADTGGNLGIVVPSTVSGELVTVRYDPNHRQLLGQAVTTLSQQSGALGFDFMVDVGYSAGRPAKALSLSYPRRGRAAPASHVAFAHPAAGVVGYTWNVDGTKAANTVYGVGSGTGSSSTAATGPLRSIKSDPSQLSAGYPLLETVVNRSDVLYQTILDKVTAEDLAAVKTPPVTPIVTVTTDCPDPVFGTYDIGDDVRLMLDPDPYHPAGHDQWWRVISWTVSPADQGVGTVAVTLDIPPVVT